MTVTIVAHLQSRDTINSNINPSPVALSIIHHISGDVMRTRFAEIGYG